MEDAMISSDEIISVAYLNKKRKLQGELLEVPLPKHVRWGQRIEYEFSSDFTIDPNKMESSIFAGGGESDPESVNHSYSFAGDANSSSMSSPASVEPTTSSTYCKASSSKSDTRSFGEEVHSHHPDYKLLPHECHNYEEILDFEIQAELHSSHPDYGMLPHECHNYEDILDFENRADVNFSEYQHDGVENCENKELEDLLCSNGVDASNYVLSSGRWSVNQDIQEKPKKTIDKEFEEYFSMLML